jgi:hypothetical protein
MPLLLLCALPCRPPGMNDATGRGQFGWTRLNGRSFDCLRAVIFSRRERGVGLRLRRGWVIPPSHMRPQEKNYPRCAREFFRWTRDARAQRGRGRIRADVPRRSGCVARAAACGTASRAATAVTEPVSSAGAPTDPRSRTSGPGTARSRTACVRLARNTRRRTRACPGARCVQCGNSFRGK